VERRLRFGPLYGGVLDPERRVSALALVQHALGIQELDSEVKRTHRGVFVEMPDQFIPQRVRIGLIEVEGACGIGSGRRGRNRTGCAGMTETRP
jgi:hypothetical protein